MFEKHYQAMAEFKPEAMKYLQENHKKLWTRSQFSTLSKVDYITNNLAEVFNKWVSNNFFVTLFALVSFFLLVHDHWFAILAGKG